MKVTEFFLIFGWVGFLATMVFLFNDSIVYKCYIKSIKMPTPGGLLDLNDNGIQNYSRLRNVKQLHCLIHIVQSKVTSYVYSTPTFISNFNIIGWTQELH